MITHTPGPWITFESDGAYAVLPAGRRGQIAVDLTLADANLIAAAPDMLAVLNAARIVLKNRDQDTREMKLLDAIKLAIAKAVGDTVVDGKGEAT